MFSKQSNHLSLDILFNSLDSKICCGLKNNYHCVIIRIIPLHCCSKQCCYFNTFITQKKKMITLRFFINYRSAATVKNDISCLGSNWLVLFHRFYSKDHQYRYIANFTSFSSYSTTNTSCLIFALALSSGLPTCIRIGADMLQQWD